MLPPNLSTPTEHTPIDLGTTSDSMGCCPVSPCDSGKKYYPGVYLTLPAGTALPKEGEICFRYVLSTVKADLKAKTICYDLELRALVETEAGAPAELKTAEQALADYAPED